MKQIFVFLSLIIASGLLLTNIFTSIVDAPNWGSNIPASIEVARQYYQTSNPGNFFRIFSPINQMLALICVILFWKRGKDVRGFLIVAFLLYVAAEGLTFMYFYPRNDIMFKPGVTDTATLKTAWQEWDTMNWVRTLLIVVGVGCTSMGLHRSYVKRG